jgi:hypothetical protein
VVARHNATSVTGAHAATAAAARDRAAPSKATWPPCDTPSSPMRGARCAPWVGRLDPRHHCGDIVTLVQAAVVGAARSAPAPHRDRHGQVAELREHPRRRRHRLRRTAPAMEQDHRRRRRASSEEDRLQVDARPPNDHRLLLHHPTSMANLATTPLDKSPQAGDRGRGLFRCVDELA